MSLRYDPVTMATGLPEIDEQHQELIDQLNRLLEGMKAGRAQEELEPLLGFLVRYTRTHFSYEEGCMARHRCPSAAANRAAHQQFAAMLDGFGREVRQQGPSVALVLKAQRELGAWIRNHIVRTDTHLRGCVAPGASGV